MEIVKQSNTSEPGAHKLAFLDSREGERPVGAVVSNEPTPFEVMAKREERGEMLLDYEISEVRVGAISALLSYLFAKTNGKLPTVHEVALRLFLTAYLVSPALIDGMSLESIGKLFDRTRACLSARVIKMNDSLAVKSRNQKGSLAVEMYRDKTTAYHLDKMRKEQEAARKEYLKKWRADHSDEIAAYNAAYRDKNRERLNAAKRVL